MVEIPNLNYREVEIFHEKRATMEIKGKVFKLRQSKWKKTPHTFWQVLCLQPPLKFVSVCLCVCKEYGSTCARNHLVCSLGAGEECPVWLAGNRLCPTESKSQLVMFELAMKSPKIIPAVRRKTFCKAANMGICTCGWYVSKPERQQERCHVEVSPPLNVCSF